MYLGGTTAWHGTKSSNLYITTILLAVGKLFLDRADNPIEFEWKWKINLKVEQGKIEMKIDTRTDVSIGITLFENIVEDIQFSYKKDKQELKYDKNQEMSNWFY